MSPEQRWRHNELRRQRNCDRGPALSGELCDATLIGPQTSRSLHRRFAGRFMQLALNGLTRNEQVPAATRRGKNDTPEYLYDLAFSEARPVEGISGHR